MDLEAIDLCTSSRLEQRRQIKISLVVLGSSRKEKNPRHVRAL
jgi:hypothetical protein